MKKWIYICIAVAILFVIVGVYGPGPEKLKVSPIAELLAQLATALGIFGLFYQFRSEKELLKSEKKLNEADFIYRINSDFITNQSINKIYKKLEESKIEIYKKLKKSKDVKHLENPFKTNQITDIANYLSQFELLNHLLDAKVINIETIDAVLSYRFFLATNNIFVQEMLLCKEGKNDAWKQIFLLYKKWYKYRDDNNKDIILENFCLSEVSAYKNIVKSN